MTKAIVPWLPAGGLEPTTDDAKAFREWLEYQADGLLRRELEKEIRAKVYDPDQRQDDRSWWALVLDRMFDLAISASELTEAAKAHVLVEIEAERAYAYVPGQFASLEEYLRDKADQLTGSQRYDLLALATIVVPFVRQMEFEANLFLDPKSFGASAKLRAAIPLLKAVILSNDLSKREKIEQVTVLLDQVRDPAVSKRQLQDAISPPRIPRAPAWMRQALGNEEPETWIVVRCAGEVQTEFVLNGLRGRVEFGDDFTPPEEWVREWMMDYQENDE